MSAIQMTDDQLRLVEKLGVQHERMGLQPAAARVMALLVVADRSELTFDEIREALQLSKSATSNAINILLATQRIEYITHPGSDRKRYFRDNTKSWKDNIAQKFEEMQDLVEILKEVLAQRTPETPQLNDRLRNLIDFLEFFHAELPSLIAKWDSRKRG